MAALFRTVEQVHSLLEQLFHHVSYLDNLRQAVSPRSLPGFDCFRFYLCLGLVCSIVSVLVPNSKVSGYTVVPIMMVEQLLDSELNQPFRVLVCILLFKVLAKESLNNQEEG